MRAMAVVMAALVLGAGLGLAAEKAEPDAEGFISLFNGKDLEGWDGRPELWSVKNGAIHGEHKGRRGNTFCIWRGGTLKDFELLITFRINNGNSGIQYRSVDVGKWVVSGYQAEVCNQKGKVGFLYHERGRGYLCRVGQKVVVHEDGKKEVVEKFGDPQELTKDYKPKDWNQYRIVARGNHLVHYLNGVKTVDFTDNQLDDPKAEKPNLKRGRLEGILALQLHGGGAMWVEFKDIKLKVLEPEEK
ncbi:MAG: DUF1080 domain-containing protein [Candidatus Brocadiia bacterium]